MSNPPLVRDRTRAYFEFIAAVAYFFLARSLATHAAAGLAGITFAPLAMQAMFLFLLIVGFAGFGLVLDRQTNPVSAQGLPFREGWLHEAGLGIAVGWGAAVVCVLLMALFGGIAIVLTTQFSALGWLISDTAFFALAAMAEEVAFRGYGFQRFAAVVGPIGASLGYAAFYAILQAALPGSSRISVVVSVVFSLLLATAYLRTRALWLSWGINFAWKASRALIFGLAVSGITSHSPIVEGDPMGPFWLTGGGFGLEGSWTALLVLLGAMLVVHRVTRDLDFRYNAPVIVPGGIPVDLDAAARAQHEAAMGSSEAAPPPLVQIMPVTAPSASKPAEMAPPVAPDSGQSAPTH